MFYSRHKPHYTSFDPGVPDESKPNRALGLFIAIFGSAGLWAMIYGAFEWWSRSAHLHDLLPLK
jgi:hypothetical protein